MKKLFKNYPKDSAEYVVLHARWTKKKGRNPSCSFLYERNPQKALRLAERLAYFPEGNTYLEGTIPLKYKCADCGASDCKLWREYQTVAPKLLCAPCAAKDQDKNIDDIDQDGMHTGEFDRTDQIGWYVPAVPTEDGDSYWGYTSVPGPAVSWWKKLPTLPKKKAEEEIPSRLAGRVKQFQEGTGDW